MARQRTEPTGRQDELAALRWDGSTPALKVVRGDAGSGKTAVLGQVRRELAEQGFVVIEMDGSAERPDWDAFGAHLLLDAIRGRFEELGAGLVTALDAVGKLCTADGYSSPWRRFCLLNAFSALFTTIRATAPIAVLADDAHLLGQPVAALTTAQRAGHFVVAACPDGPSELSERADEVIELRPLPDPAVDTLLRQLAGIPVDPVLPRVLQDALGCLYGNPGTLVSTMADLREQGRLATVQGRLCLRDPGEPVRLPASHPLMVELDRCGDAGRELVALASSAVGCRVDDIPMLAAATGRAPLAYGRAADQLVLAGVLDSESTGRLRNRCRALTVEPGDLHRLVAESLLAQGRHGPVTAGHIAAAGRSMAPRPELLEVLQDKQSKPFAAVSHAYAAWWHSRDRDLRAELIRLLVRAGDYTRLAQVVEESIDQADEELAIAAALVAIHSGQRMSAAFEGTPQFALCRRWFAGEEIRLDEVVACFAPGTVLSDRDLEAFCASRELGTVFSALLGPDYRVPDSGPLAAYHRVCREYAGTDWSSALSAARELELDPRADAAAKRYSRMLAAEMADWRGEDRQAESWRVPGDYPALRELPTRLNEVLACLPDGDVAALTEAYETARAIGASRLIAEVKRALARFGAAPAATRARTDELSELQHRIIELIRQGRTNRQIAVAVLVSEKTVEKHLTRLFAKAGCRTRHGLATSGLGGRLEPVSA
ncbi:regulatory protein, luxR family [Amycolatopsis xylanica]|uniref:Regulatory protein, luxR family n=2 Tax=Amycolatopsis xylanica TaxID=589385 RepID=A0A1H3GZ08_9PSEU|nr:regulatory protein, luxR family [Amycolatopsis xylanica]